MQTSRFLKIVIVVLLIINLASLFFIWRNSGEHHGPPRGPRIEDFLTEELKLNTTQQDQLKQLKFAHHQAVVALSKKNSTYRDVLYDCLGKATIDTTLVNQYADSIMYTQRAIELVTYYHFREVRSICTPTQQKQFDLIIKEALETMAPRPDGPPNGPPAGPPPH